jgi:acyl-CoA reductase-like NAD-dependent aldehyde dehydrogenase
VATEEVFGPVLAVLPFQTEDEALRLAHATGYRLAASVWSADLGLAHRMARRLRVGNVWVNTYGDVSEHVSIGGMGDSGYGRELGPHAVHEYTATRALWFAHR